MFYFGFGVILYRVEHYARYHDQLILLQIRMILFFFFLETNSRKPLSHTFWSE